MRCSLSLPFVVIASTAWCADTPKPIALSSKEIADGWIQLFDGSTTFGWKTQGDVAVTDGVMVFGGSKSASITTTTSFGPAELRVSYQVEGNQPVVVTMHGLTKFGVPGSEKWQELTWPSNETYIPTTPLHFAGGNGAKWLIRSIQIRPTGLQPIFNGKDLSGWKQYAGDANRSKSKFTVTPEGWLNVTNGPGDLQTERQWADFVFQGECISNGKHLNSGLFFRCLPGQYQQGYEMQVRNQWEGDDRTKPVDFGTGAIYRRQPARKVVSTDGEWFTMTLVAHGNHFATWVNGYQVTDWTDPRPENANARNGSKLGAGPISIQGHDPTTNLSFRNLRVAELPKMK